MGKEKFNLERELLSIPLIELLSSFWREQKIFSVEEVEKAFYFTGKNITSLMQSEEVTYLPTSLPKNWMLYRTEKKETYERYNPSNPTRVYKTVYSVYKPTIYMNEIDTCILRILLSSRIPWFNKFSWQIYCNTVSIKDGMFTDWLFLNTELGTLYVPTNCLLENNWYGIYESHTDYFNDWYKRFDKNLNPHIDGEKHLKDELAILESKTAMELKELMKISFFDYKYHNKPILTIY